MPVAHVSLGGDGMSEYLQTLHREHAARRERLFPVQAPRIAASWPGPPKEKPKPKPKPYKFKRALIKRIWADPAKRNRQIPGLTAQDVIAATAKHYGVWPTSIIAPIRTAKLIAPRHMAMYLCREFLAKRSFPELARQFKKHHVTCVHGCQSIAKQLRDDAAVQAAHDKIRAALFEIGDRA